MGKLGSYYLQLASEMMWGHSCRTEPLTWGIWHCLQVDNIRIEFNCKLSSWCHRSLLGEGKAFTHLVIRSEVFCVNSKRHRGKKEITRKIWFPPTPEERWVFPFQSIFHSPLFSFIHPVLLFGLWSYRSLPPRPQTSSSTGLSFFNPTGWISFFQTLQFFLSLSKGSLRLSWPVYLDAKSSCVSSFPFIIGALIPS